MKRIAIFVLVGLIAIASQWSLLTAHSAEGRPDPVDNGAHSIFTLFLPVITQGGASSPTTVPTLTPTLVSTAPTAAPTLTPTATGTSAVATPTAAATATSTVTPTPSPTATLTQTPTATATPPSAGTATPTATATTTPTATPTTTPSTVPTATPTSITFPDIILSCAAEPDINDARALKITVQTTAPTPSTASFKFVPTQLTGPVDNILRPGPTTFQLVNIFSNQSAATSDGWLARCDTANTCTATYTLTETSVTRYIGATVDCQF